MVLLRVDYFIALYLYRSRSAVRWCIISGLPVNLTENQLVMIYCEE